MTTTLDTTDRQLLKGCKAGSRIAQHRLYQRYYGRMRGIAMRYTAHPEEADDVLNRAFLKVFESIDRYQPTGSFGGWIARIVFRTSIDHVRSQARYQKSMDFEVVIDDPTAPDVLGQLYAEDLIQLLQQLPAATRTVFSLYVVDGQKHREIADLLGISINTSKWHLRHARKLLQAAARDLGYHPREAKRS